LSGGAHRSQVGSEIEDACQAKQENNWVKKNSGMMLAHVSSNSDPRNSADTGRDFLHRGHEGIGEQHHPEHAISELSSGLGVCGDSARVVVRGSCNKTWTEFLKKRFPW